VVDGVVESNYGLSIVVSNGGVSLESLRYECYG